MIPDYETEISKEISKRILDTNNTELVTVSFGWDKPNVVTLRTTRRFKDDNIAWFAIDDELLSDSSLAYIKSDSIKGIEDKIFSRKEFNDYMEDKNIFFISDLKKFEYYPLEMKSYFIGDNEFKLGYSNFDSLSELKKDITNVKKLKLTNN